MVATKIVLVAAALAVAGTGGYIGYRHYEDAATPSPAEAPAGTIALTITSGNGTHAFAVEVAKTEEEQQRGLMFRTTIPRNGGMLFAPYPPTGGPPREASFWMKNTPSPLDIVFIRADGTIARIAENTVPQSETPIPSGEPVGAVLEIGGGRALDLGIAEGDRVAWAGHNATGIAVEGRTAAR